MNIFVLDYMPITAARFYCNSHLLSGILEITTMMGLAYDDGDFKPISGLGSKNRYYNYSMSRWVRLSRQNFDWTLQHTYALCDEFLFRYEHQHSYRPHIDWISRNLPMINLSDFGLTDWPRCFGAWKDTVGVTNDVVYDYRRYYMLAKRFAVWTRRPTPEWFR